MNNNYNNNPHASINRNKLLISEDQKQLIIKEYSEYINLFKLHDTLNKLEILVKLNTCLISKIINKINNI